MPFAAIQCIESYLPERVLDNQALAEATSAWTEEKIFEKTGIRERRLAAGDEFVSDMAVKAAEKVFARGEVQRGDIDFILLCTQSPDYFLPTTACLVQERLGLPTRAGALDFNLGCSGFIYGLGLAKGLVETGQARKVLLLTSETYSKFIHPKDASVRTLFGDAAAATVVTAVEGGTERIGPFVYGTDGSGAGNLIVPAGGMRTPRRADAPEEEDANGNRRTINNLYMNGPEIFTFTLKNVPELVEGLLGASGLAMDQVDLYVFHQANAFMLEALRRKIRIPKDRFVVNLAETGNTVSSTIPLALAQCLAEQRLVPGMTAMLAGFGVGYSWGATLVRI
jgi:3-oxoacyl-[acyl-carrier-protein] synthase-3